jgi:hypothetical protein
LSERIWMDPCGSCASACVRALQNAAGVLAVPVRPSRCSSRAFYYWQKKTGSTWGSASPTCHWVYVRCTVVLAFGRPAGHACMHTVVVPASATVEPINGSSLCPSQKQQKKNTHPLAYILLPPSLGISIQTQEITELVKDIYTPHFILPTNSPSTYQLFIFVLIHRNAYTVSKILNP